MDRILQSIALGCLVSGLVCMVIDMLRERRGIKRMGFMAYISEKGGESRLGKAFPLLMIASILFMWISQALRGE